VLVSQPPFSAAPSFRVPLPKSMPSFSLWVSGNAQGSSNQTRGSTPAIFSASPNVPKIQNPHSSKSDFQRYLSDVGNEGGEVACASHDHDDAQPAQGPPHFGIPSSLPAVICCVGRLNRRWPIEFELVVGRWGLTRTFGALPSYISRQVAINSRDTAAILFLETFRPPCNILSSTPLTIP
jgi:hypothetical protein